MNLNWDNNTESDPQGYTIYRSTTSGIGYSAIATGVGVSAYTDGRRTFTGIRFDDGFKQSVIEWQRQS